MLKFSIILFFNFFVIIYAPDTENGATQIFPLVFFLKTDGNRDLQPPDTLESRDIVIANGGIINGTKFTVRVPAQQMFFCPKENSDENCLEPREFQGEELLQCAKEAVPVVPKDSTITLCGSRKSGTSHEFVYEFCPEQQPYISGTKYISIYSFCYDETDEKTLFTYHYIMSPELLKSGGLFWERLVNYPMGTIAGFAPSIELPPQIDPSAYEQQKLVPSADMAFALWRKLTFRNVNVGWQHIKLKPIWDEINNHIRLAAETLFIKSRTRIYAQTGVFQLSSTQRNDGQLSNVWVKILNTMSEDPKDNSMSGIAILMNNFIDGANQSVNPNETETIDYYCDNKNLTAQSLTTKVNNVGGKIRCCPLNSEVAGLFGEQDIASLSVLHIPNVMKPIE